MACFLPDAALPSATAQTGGEMREVLNYLYLLREQLRYSMENLDADNFNETGLRSLGDIITAPLAARIENDEGELTSLRLTADGLSTRVKNAEGSISTLRQSVNGFDLEVTNGVSSSTVKLTNRGAVIASEEIRFSGMVTFEDLSGAGTTVINGSNITTGMIQAISMRSCEFNTLLTTDGTVGGSIKMWYYKEGTIDVLAGTIRLDDQGAGSENEGKYRMFLSTNSIWYDGNRIDFNLKLRAAGGVSVESVHSGIYLASGTDLMETAAGNLYLRAGGQYYIYEPNSGAYVTLQSYIGSHAGVALFG